jgi:protein phosphatase
MATASTNNPTFTLESLRCAAGTDVGMRREENQDSFGVIKGEGFQAYFVADGMGGAHGGAVASRMAIGALQDELRSPGFRVAPATIGELVSRINSQIYDRGVKEPAFAGMGTTLVGLIFTREGLILVNVGDSRAYRIRNRSIVQMSEDHTLVRELVKTGALTASEAENHPVSHMLTRSLGPVRAINIDCTVVAEVPQFGDTYVLCSDGLYNLVPARDIQAVVSQNPIDDANQILINLANQRGGSDNITALVISVGEGTVRSRGAMPTVSISDAEFELPTSTSDATHQESGEDVEVTPPPVQEPAHRRSFRKEVSEFGALKSYRSSRIPVVILLMLSVGLGLFLGDSVRRVGVSPSAGRGSAAPDPESTNSRGSMPQGSVAEPSLEQSLRTREEIMQSLKELNERIESLAGEVSKKDDGPIIGAALEAKLASVRGALVVATKEAQLWKARKMKLTAGVAADIEDERKKVAAYSEKAQEQLASFTAVSLDYLRALDEQVLRPNDVELRSEIGRLEQEQAAAQKGFEAEVLNIATTKYQESSRDVVDLTKELAELEGRLVPTSKADAKRSGAQTGSRASSGGEKPLQAILDHVSPKDNQR